MQQLTLTTSGSHKALWTNYGENNTFYCQNCDESSSGRLVLITKDKRSSGSWTHRPCQSNSRSPREVTPVMSLSLRAMVWYQRRSLDKCRRRFAELKATRALRPYKLIQVHSGNSFRNSSAFTYSTIHTLLCLIWTHARAYGVWSFTSFYQG